MRARYQGQEAGDESRGAADSFGEFCSDGAIAEGRETETISRLFTSGDWPALTRYTDALQAKGWALNVVQRMLTCAMAGKRIPKRGGR